MPYSYQKKGTILQLQKAMYGLRISPMLWQKEFTTTLKSMGFQDVLHKPCCIIKDGILLFFYVDNIIVAYHKNKLNAATEAVNMLKENYTITRGDNLQ
jgi:hypothetical protein